MLIHSQREALDAFSEVLDLPDKVQQLARLTELIGCCTTDEPRQFLINCQAGIMENGLETLRRRRKKSLSQLKVKEERESQVRGPRPETVIIVEMEKDELLEQVGAAIDALSMTKTLQDVLPSLSLHHQKWQIARAIRGHETMLRDCLKSAIQGSQSDKELNQINDQIVTQIQKQAPSWAASVNQLREACSKSMNNILPPIRTPGPADDPELAFAVIAQMDDTAGHFLEGNDSVADSTMENIRTRMLILQEAKLLETK